MILVRSLFSLALAVWVGAVVFFSLVVAPGMFAALPRETAGTALGVLFPRYYALGVVVGAVTVGAAALLWRRQGGRAWAAINVMSALMLAATLYAGAVVEPRARALRPLLHAEQHADPATQTEFDRLHHLAVELNGAVLLLGIVTICVAANR